MKTIAVIIDFDNYFGVDFTLLDSEKLECSFCEIVEFCEKEFGKFETIDIRLYGGWYFENSLSKQASVLQQMLYNVNVFPKVIEKEKRVIKGNINIISELHEMPGHIWSHTLKESNGIKRVKINNECDNTICESNRDVCPKYIMSKFTKSKVKKCSQTGCTNTNKNVFKGIEQKMVDTLIACDILSFADDESVKGLLILSDDQDHFPSIAVAMKKQEYKQDNKIESIILGIKNSYNFEFISSLLNPLNIKTQLLT